MKKYKILGMSQIEKTKALEKAETELVKLMFNHKNGQLDKGMKIRELRRDIARLKTYIHQEDLEATNE
ncbi:MAG TPA: 50S ribosomal protein L29 [Caldisericia bacterium]|nr:50S ribosomal protein L29 [Caldisericia bacterium]HPF49288.1 50S ribosomal protein L29 [Caldisericia bacterium]HPI84032.1 50S ribosomal protein L29 [Caldisericia bacterium]HPQ93290.1 50S ribosomal protein L29 [Caldisericia bacterium]HRV75328.1 50S ribosomal protein L29 [Caldisericia bacterium]